MIIYRQATAEDRWAALANFLFSFRTAYAAGLIAHDRWLEVMSPEAERIFGLPGVELLVAANPNVPPASASDIFGWLAFRRRGEGTPRRALGPRAVFTATSLRPLVIYCYVKTHYRGRGIARGLFREAGIDPWNDHYDFVARSTSLVEKPDRPLAGGWTRPMIERMRNARWNPLSVRGGIDERSQDGRTDGGQGSGGHGGDRSGSAGAGPALAAPARRAHRPRSP